ncbi:MAG TPA: prephenate dehydrogenase, partial [Beutenbergiaceae bacterium]|nr:prephenate dehydrogenase [Beutenbergiaceae bacterium]
GLLGASVGIGLTALDVPVRLRDTSPTAEALARDVGAGEIDQPEDPEPALVVVATPPDVTAGVIGSALHMYPNAVVTDVASVKGVILDEVRGLADLDLTRYVGGHPMAGREKTGPAAATGELFAGRPWVVCPHEDTDPQAELAVRHLASDLGASPVVMTPTEHDHAVSLVSHVPQLVSSLVAARLVEAPEQALGLAGQGLRDLTRIAASDPKLWTAIITGNAEAVREILRAVRDDLDGLLSALDRGAEDGPLAVGAMHTIAAVMSAGNDGVSRIPGKHGGRRKRYQEVVVLVPDQPGELGRLFSEIGEIGVNIEDFSMEHSPKQKVGMAAVSVLPTRAQLLESELTKRGWKVVAK